MPKSVNENVMERDEWGEIQEKPNTLKRVIPIVLAAWYFRLSQEIERKLQIFVPIMISYLLIFFQHKRNCYLFLRI